MSYVDPKVQKQFDTLSPDLQKAIMDKNIPIHSVQDLIRVLDNIANG